MIQTFKKLKFRVKICLFLRQEVINKIYANINKKYHLRKLNRR